MKVSSHSNYVATAKKEMGNKRYVEAYKSLNGLTLSDEETVVYKKARLLAAIDQQLQSCDTYIEMNRTTEALNSLIIGVKKYNKHLSEAETLEITGEYNSLRKEISDKLNDEFALSYSQADSLAQMTDRKQYTQLVETYANRDDNK